MTGKSGNTTKASITGKDGHPTVTPGLSIAAGGLVLSVALSAIIPGTLRANPRLLLRSYPPGIRRAAGEQTETERTKTRIIGAFFLLVLLGVPAVCTWMFERALGGTSGSRQPSSTSLAFCPFSTRWTCC